MSPKAPIGNKPGVTNWVEEQGGLPPYIRRIAEHVKGDGHTDGSSIAIAVSQAEKSCAKGNAEACASVAQWKAMVARANM